jgi:hypothetical protein
MRKLVLIAVALQASFAMAAYVEMVNPYGNLTQAVATWVGGVLPSGSSTGRVDAAVGNVWSDTFWNNLAVRQEGGYVTVKTRADGASGDGSFAMRGGLSGSGITTIYEIDDARTDYASYTNFYVSGTFTLWSQYNEPIELSILSGHVAAANITLLSKNKIIVNMRDGILHAEYMAQGQGKFNMLAGGTGDITMDVLNADANLLSGNLALNFEDGNAGSFTFGEKTGGLSAAGTWEALVAAGQVSIDGVVDKRQTFYTITDDGLGTTIALNPARTNYVTFIGQNNNSASPVGGLVDDRNWEGGVMPAGSTTGLVYTTSGVWAGIHQDLAVRQEGGFVNAGAKMVMRGGTTNYGYTTLYEIEDVRTDYESYTNLNVVSSIEVWSQYGQPIEFSLLSGHVEAGGLGLISKNQTTFNLRDGIFNVGTAFNLKAHFNMLAGGTGTMTIDSLETVVGEFYLHFETGNAGSFTFGSLYETNSAADHISWLVNHGHVTIDGVVDSNSMHYAISNDGLASTIALPGDRTPGESYVAWAAFYGLTDTNSAAMSANPDGDGLDNLAEYAVGGNPNNGGDTGHAPVTAMQAEGGTNWFVFVHTERSDAAERGLSYGLERGADLIGATWDGSGIEAMGSGILNDDFNTVTNRIETDSADSQFIRLRVGLQE